MFALFLVGFLCFSAVSCQQCADAGVGICINGVGCKANEKCIDGLNICCNNFVTTPAPCFDKINPSTGYSDCTRMASYCNNSAYYTLMTDQCPKTCGRCSGNGGVTKPACVDLINPNTGRSDCPGMYAYCSNSAYYTLMTEQCPKTCGRCPA